MPYDPFTRVRIGRTDVEVTRLGFGSASIGGLFRAVNDDQAIATVEHAWDLGIRSFDVAPPYGYGTGEPRLGAALRDRPRDQYVLSTKDPATPEILERARRLADTCQRWSVPLRAAAIQFPLAHPAVAGLIAGVRRVEHLDEYPAFMRWPIPAGLWDGLRSEALIDPEAPTPP